MTDDEKKHLFLQMDRDVGTLISMLGDAIDGKKPEKSDYELLKEIAARMDDASPKLQAILYPESLPQPKVSQ